jgi:hypothetical protein
VAKDKTCQFNFDDSVMNMKNSPELNGWLAAAMSDERTDCGPPDKLHEPPCEWCKGVTSNNTRNEGDLAHMRKGQAGGHFLHFPQKL